jgi:hypothetical protein
MPLGINPLTLLIEKTRGKPLNVRCTPLPNRYLALNYRLWYKGCVNIHNLECLY